MSNDSPRCSNRDTTNGPRLNISDSIGVNLMTLYDYVYSCNRNPDPNADAVTRITANSNTEAMVSSNNNGGGGRNSENKGHLATLLQDAYVITNILVVRSSPRDTKGD